MFPQFVLLDCLQVPYRIQINFYLLDALSVLLVQPLHLETIFLPSSSIPGSLVANYKFLPYSSSVDSTILLNFEPQIAHFKGIGEISLDG